MSDSDVACCKVMGKSGECRACVLRASSDEGVCDGKVESEGPDGGMMVSDEALFGVVVMGTGVSV